MCDLSYTIQREQIVARALAEMQLAPHVKDAGQIATPEVAVAEFDAYLNEEPDDAPAGGFELEDLIRVGRR